MTLRLLSGGAELTQPLFQVGAFLMATVPLLPRFLHAALAVLCVLLGPGGGRLRLSQCLAGGHVALSLGFVCGLGVLCLLCLDAGLGPLGIGKSRSHRLVLGPAGGHVDRPRPPEAHVTEPGGQTARGQRLGGAGVEKSRLQCALQFPDGGAADGLAKVTGQPERLVHQASNQAAALFRQFAHVVMGQASLGIAQGGAEVEQVRNLLVTLAHQKVGQPGAGAGPA